MFLEKEEDEKVTKFLADKNNAVKHGIKYSTFRSWRTRYKKGQYGYKFVMTLLGVIDGNPYRGRSS